MSKIPEDHARIFLAPNFVPSQMRCTLSDDTGEHTEIIVSPQIAEDQYPIEMKSLRGTMWEFNRNQARELAAALIAAADLYEAHNPHGIDQ